MCVEVCGRLSRLAHAVGVVFYAIAFEFAQKYLEAQKKYYRVIEFYRRPVELVEDATFRLAKISAIIERYELAVRWFSLACNRDPQRCLMDGDALFYRGTAHSAIGQDREAVENLQRFANIFPGDPRYDEAMLTLAASLSKLGDAVGAAVTLGIVSKSQKTEPRVEALLKLAKLEEETGKKFTVEGALGLYKQILEEAPYSGPAMEASLRIAQYLFQRHSFKSTLRYLDWFFTSYDENRFTLLT